MGCALENTDLPLNKLYHRGHSELRASLHTTLTTVPTRHSPRLSVNGTHRHMDEDTEQAVPLLATCARGIVPCYTTWAVAIVRRLYRGTEEPSRMLFLSTQKKENYS